MGEARISQAFLMDEQERLNLAKDTSYAHAQSLPEVWSIAAQRFANITATIDPHSKPETHLTYAQLYAQMQQFAAGLQSLGVTPAAGDEYPPELAYFPIMAPVGWWPTKA